ncbi:haloalkane dehalogenase [Sungkyunkwania multivorans]|uniref:Haloalkane dehalogenase n=1 Tax=Sungkyunkwania multivorans TaxID=1173618 RepID=A0ABW3CZW7_9FLAO
MKILKTPASRFENLPDYPFQSNFCEMAEGLRMHYLDEGDGPIVLLLHGEPSWSFLYRKMIPIFKDAGFRVIAPDLIGFGKSDKPSETSDYSFQNHIDWLKQLIFKLGLKDINLFCQDWGGLTGLRIAAEEAQLFSRIVVSNTFLPMSGLKANEAFRNWRDFSQKVPEFPVSTILQKATVSELSKEILAAYDAPFPDETFKSGARIFPALVPFEGEDPHNALPACDAAWEVLKKWTKPLLTLFGDSDPIMKGGDKYFQLAVPGAKGQEHREIKGGGHFIQEDAGEELAKLMIAFIQKN